MWNLWMSARWSLGPPREAEKTEERLRHEGSCQAGHRATKKTGSVSFGANRGT